MDFMEEVKQYQQSNLLHTQESLLKYRDGGFHPVCLGDTFRNDRYKIHHKLGFGGFSTVWLAEDRKYAVVISQGQLTNGSRRMRWVSIKILTVSATVESQELALFRSLTALCDGDLSSRYIVQLLDEFLHQGPNGTHQCLVFELLGPTVDMIISTYHDLADPEDILEAETTLKISEQLLNAVAFIHEAGYSHGGRSYPKFYRYRMSGLFYSL